MLPGIHTIAPVPVKKPEKCCKQIIPISFNVSALALGQSYNSEILKYIAGLVQERHNSNANALELRLSCPNPSIYSKTNHKNLSQTTGISFPYIERYVFNRTISRALRFKCSKTLTKHPRSVIKIVSISHGLYLRPGMGVQI